MLIIERVKFRNRPYRLFYFHLQRYIQKGRFSVEIYIPFLHLYFENETY